MQSRDKSNISIEEIFSNDSQAIKWLNSIEEPKFRNSLEIINKYAEECLAKLSEKDLSQGLDEEQKIGIIQKVKQYISKQEDFRKKCLIETEKDDIEEENGLKLGIFNQQEIDYIRELSDEEIKKLALKGEMQTAQDKDMFSKIRKANRFYNMQLKFAHTARIVKVADEITNTFEGGLNPFLKEVILTSSLMHDIGRFYQAREYDDFIDSKMKLDREEYGSGHSKVGYYYSMMDLFRMNCFKDKVDKDLLIRTISGFVVSYHSENNVNLENDGIIANEECIKDFDENLLEGEQLDNLIGKIYKNAEFIHFDESEEKQKEFIKKFMAKMIVSKGADTLEALGFDKQMETEIVENISLTLDDKFITKTNNFFETYNRTSEQENKNVSIDDLSHDLSITVNEGSNLQFDSKDVEGALIDMANYDVAKSIYDSFKEKGSEEEEKLKGALFACPINIVMDADKIDILNQLASGTYPINYSPKEYKSTAQDRKVSKEEAFKRFWDGTEDIVIRQSDSEDFAKYNGLERKYNSISPVRSTLWLLNQFLFTNMRNKGSLVFVKDNRYVEKIYEQFSADKDIQDVLKPYMAYSLFFLDRASKMPNNMLTPDVMKSMCEETSLVYGENEDIRHKYEELFDGDLMQNREDFLAEKRTFSVNEIGKATIGASIIAKKEAEQVEFAESTKDTIKEGEEGRYAN